MIAFKKEDPVLKRSNKILTGVENRLRVVRQQSMEGIMKNFIVIIALCFFISVGHTATIRVPQDRKSVV